MLQAFRSELVRFLSEGRFEMGSMRLLVTGATGQVGSRSVPRLLQRGHDVRILVRDQAKAEPLAALGAEVITGDIQDPGSLAAACQGVDVVIHLAAAFRPGIDEATIMATNTDGTISLAGQAKIGRAHV